MWAALLIAVAMIGLSMFLARLFGRSRSFKADRNNWCLVAGVLFALTLSLPRSHAAEALSVGVETYGTVGWTGINGEPETGLGATLLVGITKNVALTFSGESDDSDHSFVDRAVLGIRYTVPFGTRVTADLGLGLGGDFEREHLFARIPAGLNFYALRTKSVDLGVRASYALDVTGTAQRGTATGRAFLGPVFNFRF